MISKDMPRCIKNAKYLVFGPGEVLLHVNRTLPMNVYDCMTCNQGLDLPCSAGNNMKIVLPGHTDKIYRYNEGKGQPFSHDYLWIQTSINLNIICISFA